MAEEVGQLWENVPVDFAKGEHKSADYLKLNPNGKVPVVVEGDYVIWESMAINAYFAEKYKPEMLGTGIEQHGHVQQWSYWAIANLSHAVEVLAIQKWRSTPDDDSTAKAHESLVRFLPILEASLAGKNYLVGDTFTVADLNVASNISAVLWIGTDMSAYPNITRWFTTIAQRPAFQKTIGKK
jgi:glutathione S-transferase